MKSGFRKPSFNKRLAARTSWKRVVRHNLDITDKIEHRFTFIERG